MNLRPIRRVSKKRAYALRLYNAAAKRFLIAFPTCMVCLNEDSDQVHHMRGRGIWLLIQKFWMAVCFRCHMRIEGNRKWATEYGYLLPREGVEAIKAYKESHL